MATALTALHQPAHRASSLDRPGHTRFERSLAIGVLGFAIGLASTLILGGGAPLAPDVVVASAVAAGVWTAALRAASSAVPPVVGAAFAASVGTLGGLVLVSAVAPWIATLTGVELRPAQLLEMAAAVLVLAVLWTALLKDSNVRRRRIMIVGTTDCVDEVAAELAASKAPAFMLVGDLTSSAEGGSGRPPDRGELSALLEVVEAQRPDIVVVADDACGSAVDQLLDAAGDGSPRVIGLAGFFEHAFGRVPLGRVTPTWFLSLIHLRQRPIASAGKRLFDLIGATLGLVVAAPLLVVIALLVRRTPGPVVFRQTRLGRGGEPFELYKFRTMYVDAEANGVCVWARQRDPRVTPVGRLLRTTHLDELPQLWNVLRGEMSLVGPRPERPELIGRLEAAIPFWGRRLMIKPGLTGWAQVNSGYADDVASGALKLSYDLWYLRHRTFALDLAICIKTVTSLLSAARGR
jgi:exopolysaccharide biosynthesis polyprenyl glycosylphosphotransferase